MSSDNNLFLRLHSWAQGQDENFVTEAFALLLRRLLEHDAGAGVLLVSRLTGGAIHVGAEGAPLVNINTQVTVEQKRPDIEISAPGALVYVEVKVGAGLSVGQLGNYRTRLQTSGIARTALVLLTRYRAWIEVGQEPDVELRWFQVANWLEKILESGELRSEVSYFLVEQFLEFLRGRGMALDRVSKELAGGTKALVGLLGMLENALIGYGLKVATNAQWRTWLGYSVENGSHYVGVYLNEAHLLRFRTYGVIIDRQRAEALGRGRLWVQQGRLRWEYILDLASPELRFYDLSSGEQAQVIEDFVGGCMDDVKQIISATAVDTAPPGDDSVV